jgi:hypothetical protein
MSASEIQDYLIRLEKETKEFKEELTRISWYMRGGVTLHELFHIYSHEERSAMYQLIKENIALTKSAQMPIL